MKLQTRIPLATCAMLLAVGCSDTDRSTPLSPEPHQKSWTAPEIAQAEVTAQKLARVFAAAMREPEVRVHVRNAMRASPYNEHKLVLQEFARTASGRILVKNASQVSGVSAAEIDAWIASLPDMDFYAPFREQRLTWRGSADVAVGA